MLASLLPGLRDLRVPLTTGYLWALALWIIIGDRLMGLRLSLKTPMKELFQLADFFGKGAFLATFAFSAYLFGSLLQMDPMSNPFRNFLRIFARDETVSPAVRSSLESFIVSDVQGALQAEVEAHNRRREPDAPVLDGAAAEPDTSHPDDSVADPPAVDNAGRSDSAADSKEPIDDEEFGYHDPAFDNDYAYEVPVFTDEELAGLSADYQEEYTDYRRVELNGIDEDQCRLATSRVISDELPSLATRLVVANERLFDQYDRLHAEAEMRLNLVVPVGLLFVGLALRVEVWLLVGILLPVVLLRQASVRLKASDDLLVQSVISGVVESTAAQAVRRWVVAKYRRGLGKID